MEEIFMRLILASGSPRRKELLEKAGMKFEIIPAKGEEVIVGTEPAEIVKGLSAQKAREVAGTIEGDDYLVIGADTVVSYRGKILGKPGDEANAVSMLRMLTGETHQVYTGVTLIACRAGELTEKTFYECTDVVFLEVSEQTILDYVASGEPMDKAGAYAIQGGWGPHVKEIRGDYDNVVGLPVTRLLAEMEGLC